MAVTVVFKQQHQKLSPKPTVCSRPIPEFVSVVCTIRAADRPAGRSLNLGRDGEAETREGPVPGKGRAGQVRPAGGRAALRDAAVRCGARTVMLIRPDGQTGPLRVGRADPSTSGYV